MASDGAKRGPGDEGGAAWRSYSRPGSRLRWEYERRREGIGMWATAAGINVASNSKKKINLNDQKTKKDRKKRKTRSS